MLTMPQQELNALFHLVISISRHDFVELRECPFTSIVLLYFILLISWAGPDNKPFCSDF